jgi:hypothetical protein
MDIRLDFFLINTKQECLRSLCFQKLKLHYFSFILCLFYFKVLLWSTNGSKAQNTVHIIQFMCLLFFSFFTEEHHQQINFVKFCMTFRMMAKQMHSHPIIPLYSPRLTTHYFSNYFMRNCFLISFLPFFLSSVIDSCSFTY